jgi:capsular polysaccharide biosynthesis protein
VSAAPTPSGSVELRDYLAVFRRRLVVILAVTLLGAAAAAAYSFRRTPVYESSASVLVRAITTNAFDPGSRVDQQLNMFNQRQLAQSEPVAAVAAKSLRTTATPGQLLGHVKVEVPANSQILRVRYRDTVPLTAQRGADAFARAYLPSARPTPAPRPPPARRSSSGTSPGSSGRPATRRRRSGTPTPPPATARPPRPG